MAAGWDGMTSKDDTAADGGPRAADSWSAAVGPPAADSGAGRPEGTEIALVQPPGDQAGPAAAAPAVTYEFPVEISLVGELDGATVIRVAELVFAALDRELSSRL